jgi:hypothetical protein
MMFLNTNSIQYLSILLILASQKIIFFFAFKILSIHGRY